MFKPYYGNDCSECGPDKKVLIVINKPHLCDYHNRLRKGKEVIKKFPTKGIKPIKKSKRSPKYKRIYWKFFGYVFDDWIPCEIENCREEAVDIHHIKCDGMGGTKKEPDITNLMALCREHHEEYGDKKQYIDFLKERHRQIIFGISRPIGPDTNTDEED